VEGDFRRFRSQSRHCFSVRLSCLGFNDFTELHSKANRVDMCSHVSDPIRDFLVLLMQYLIHILAGVGDEAGASVSISGVSTTQYACDVHQALIKG
jgi:hypothetical protein